MRLCATLLMLFCAALSLAGPSGLSLKILEYEEFLAKKKIGKRLSAVHCYSRKLDSTRYGGQMMESLRSVFAGKMDYFNLDAEELDGDDQWELIGHIGGNTFPVIFIFGMGRDGKRGLVCRIVGPPEKKTDADELSRKIYEMVKKDFLMNQ